MNKKPMPYQGSLDKRIIEKRIRTGEILEEDLKGDLDSLPDVSANAEDIAGTLEVSK